MANNPPGSAPSQALVSRRESGIWKPVVVAESKKWLGILKVRLQSAGKNSLVLVYSGFATINDSTFSALFVSRSVDGGSTWSASKVLRKLPPPAMPLLGGLHRTTDGTLHLIWTLEATETGGATEVFHEISRDGGNTWESMKPIPALSKFDFLLSAQLGDRIVVTVRGSDALLAQALIGGTIGFQLVSSLKASGLPVNIVRSGTALETTWALFEGVATTDKKKIGTAIVPHSVTTNIRCH
ncbi:MAG: hypothetical protein ABI852_03290 [Gemmatimonadaceae bacterium]